MLIYNQHMSKIGVQVYFSQTAILNGKFITPFTINNIRY